MLSVQKVLGEVGREQIHLSHTCGALGVAVWELQGSAGMEAFTSAGRDTPVLHDLSPLSVAVTPVHCNHGKRKEIQK